MDTDPLLSTSVCREFYNRFPRGGSRRHEELVAFLLDHPSSRKKVDEWIQQEKAVQYHATANHNVSVQHNRESTGGEMPPTVLSLSELSLKYSKDNCRARKEREEGNICFKNKDLQGSLRHYNEAIKFASFEPQPTVNSNLAMALANRSAVYHELGSACYENALNDIDLALKYGYPDELKEKLICRRACIYVNQGKVELAKKSLDIIKVQSGSSGKNILSTSIRNKVTDIEMQIERLTEGMEWKERMNSPTTQNLEENRCPTFKENEGLDGASDKIRLATSGNVGRHVITEVDVNKEDILFIEQPFVSVLIPEFYDTHCHHCHKAFKNQYFFVCRRCTQVKYCSDVCSKAAEIYHEHECMWLDLLHSVGIAHLAFRIILVAGLDNVLNCVENHESLSEISNLALFTKGKHSYPRVYSLVDHITEIFEEDLFQYTLTAALLTKLMATETVYVESRSTSTHLKVGAALLRHVCQLVCNAHAITDIVSEDTPTTTVDEIQKRIATAIFPVASMMNHSCIPNIKNEFKNGKTLIVEASKRIKKGENVYNCYGPHFRRTGRQERQEILLQQYFFNCHCDMCNHELASEYSFADSFEALKCDKCDSAIIPQMLASKNAMKCPDCGILQSVAQKFDMLSVTNELYTKGRDLLHKENNLEGAIQALESCYESASKILFRHNSTLGEICDTLARCYTAKGNLQKGTEFLERSLQYVEARFGKESIEYLRESKKYESLLNHMGENNKS